ncbi:MAG: hypothetical protein KBT27_11895 [Prevotellaceae bacterium]|nr:hypothetical protein [Candidatus Faecinaster equi]
MKTYSGWMSKVYLRTDKTEYGFKAESPHAEWCLTWFTFKKESISFEITPNS